MAPILFHLLIGEDNATGFCQIEHLEEAVKLGEGGINKGIIRPEAFKRGIAAMKLFSEVISRHNADGVRAIATSALRNAGNRNEFIGEVKAQTGINIEVIDGKAEAEFIYKGIKAAGCLSDQNSLIMDIGGGSVEFIICNNREIFWKHSFEMGAARLMDKYHQADPIPEESVSRLNAYAGAHLRALFEAAEKYSLHNLIGSSGVFESYAEMTEFSGGTSINLKKAKNYKFKQNDLLVLLQKFIRSTHRERSATAGIIPVRVDMIVTASVLTAFIIQKLGIKDVLMSANSLKEGVVADMMEAGQALQSPAAIKLQKN